MKIFLLVLITLNYNFLCSQKIFYIATVGNDSNIGTEKSPFKTLAGAKDAVRKYKVKSGLPVDGITIILRAGTYEMTQSFFLDSNDNGEATKKIIYKNYPNEKVVISGGKFLEQSKFVKVTDPLIIERLPASARGKVIQCRLKTEGVTNFGDHHTKAPNGVKDTIYDPALMLYVNQKSLPVARFPNEEWIKLGKVINQGAISKIDGFKQILDTSNRGGIFEFSFPEARRWTKAKDVWLSGWFHWGWFYDEVKVSHIDVQKKQFMLASALRYGLGPTRDTSTDALNRRKYFVFNLLEEIDQPGEWYVDKISGLLYLWPPNDFYDSEIAVSVVNEPLIKGDKVSHIVFQGLTFCYGKKQAIVLEGGEDNQIKGCAFHHMSGISITISGKNHVVSDCDISHTGGGIFASGGDRRKLLSSNITISNCNIHHFSGRAIHLEGVGITVIYNEIYQANASAIDFSGNNHLIAYNRFDSLYNQGGDDLNILGIGRNPSHYGSIIKFNIFSNIGLEPNNVSSVYLDDGSCGIMIFGNIFYKASSRQIGTVFTNGGSDNTIRNNIFIDNNVCYHLGNCFHTWAAERIKDWLGPGGDFVDQLTKEVNIRDPVWVKAYPNLAKYFEDDPATPKRNVFSNNIIVNSKQPFRGDKKELNVQEILAGLEADNYIISSMPGLIDWQAKKINIGKESPIGKAIPDFQPIPIEKIGNYKNEFRK